MYCWLVCCPSHRWRMVSCYKRVQPPVFYCSPAMGLVIKKNKPFLNHCLFLSLHFQDLKPLFTIPLLGCSVEAFPQVFQGQSCFCLTQSKTSHTFTCDSLDIKRSWLSALKVAVTGWRTACSLAVCDNGRGLRSGINGSLSGENFVVNGNKEHHSWMFVVCHVCNSRTNVHCCKMKVQEYKGYSTLKTVLSLKVLCTLFQKLFTVK